MIREERIGDCRLILGDCLEHLHTIDNVGLILTDPPFEAEAHTPMRRTQKSIKTGESVCMPFAQIDDGVRLAVSSWAKLKCSGWFLAFCQVEAVRLWQEAMSTAGVKWKRGMVWNKPDSAPQFNGQMPAQGFECIAAGWCGDGASRWNGGGRRGVFTHNTNSKERHGAHPTEKPQALIRELCELFSVDSGATLDPFMGSGTTLVACAKLGRKGIGIEIDPGYFEIACKRVEEAYRQGDLFVPKPSNHAEQLSMLDDGNEA